MYIIVGLEGLSLYGDDHKIDIRKHRWHALAGATQLFVGHQKEVKE